MFSSAANGRTPDTLVSAQAGYPKCPKNSKGSIQPGRFDSALLTPQHAVPESPWAWVFVQPAKDRTASACRARVRLGRHASPPAMSGCVEPCRGKSRHGHSARAIAPRGSRPVAVRLRSPSGQALAIRLRARFRRGGAGCAFCSCRFLNDSPCNPPAPHVCPRR